MVGAYTSAVTSAVAKAAERYKVPLVNPVASKEEITRQGYKWVFRVSATTGDYAADPARHGAVARHSRRPIAILNENTDFGVSGGKSARAYAEKKGIKVVFEEAYSQGSPDYRSTLVKLKKHEPGPRLHGLVRGGRHPARCASRARSGSRRKAFLGAGAGFSTAQFANEKDISNGVFSSRSGRRR